MQTRIVTRPAIAAMALVIAWTATPRAGLAQQCRRTCETGETRDVRGCCVPAAKPARPAPRPAWPTQREPESERTPRDEPPVTTRPEPSTSSLPSPENAPGSQSDTFEPRPGQLAPGMIVPRSESEPEPTRRWSAWMPWAVVGAGVVVTGVGGVLYSTASSSYDDFDSEFDTLCRPSSGCHDEQIPQALADRLERARTLEATSRVSLLVGGITVAAGAALMFLNNKSGDSSERATTRLFLTPTLAPGVAGITFGTSL